jgi:hypothetical protein
VTCDDAWSSLDRVGLPQGYLIIGRELVPVDFETMAHELTDDMRRVGDDSVGRYRISTVFFGFALPSVDDDLLLFETAIFVEGNVVGMCRWATLDEAEAGHADAVEAARTQIGIELS